MDSIGHADKISNGSEEYLFGNWRIGHASNEIAKNLAELQPCPKVLWKNKFKGHDLRYLVK